MKRKAQRLLTMLLTLSLCVGEFNITGIRAAAEEEKTITGLGTGAITNPLVPTSDEDAWSGSYVYYGKYKDQPVKYRVLDKDSDKFGVDGGSLFLDCDSVLDTMRFDESTMKWADCELNMWLNGSDFYENTEVFTSDERSAIALSQGGSSADFPDSAFSSVPIGNANIFVLDVREVTNNKYGYSYLGYIGAGKSGEKSGAASTYWLRSHYAMNWGGYVGIVHECVYVGDDGGFRVSMPSDFDIGVSPAFNICLPSVIFSSSIKGTSGQPEAEYKLTLKDSNLSVAPDTATKADGKVAIPYKITDNSAGADPTQVSVVVTDGTWTDAGWSTGAKLLQYAKLDVDTFSLNGSGTFTLDSSITGTWGTDYHVYLLAEDVNGKYESDYASAPVEVKELIEAKYKVSFDLNGKEGTAPMPEMVAEGGKVTEPAGIAVTGYTIEGWYKEAACTNKWDFASDTVTANITLYAKWKPVNYTVKYEPNKPASASGAVNGTTADSTHTYDEAKELSANGYSLEGYTFSSWNTMADGSGESYSDKASVKNLSDTEGAVVTLYAQWSEYSHSPLDPVPEIKAETTDLWLVKGQKFIIGNDWKVADDKVSKKYVSISKKGQLKAKKADGGMVVKIKNSVTNKELTLHISKPEIDKKLTLTIVSANTAVSDQIKLTKDEHLDVLYYSAAPDVATVGQDGTVTAVAKGKAKITAYINGCAYNCNVTVKESVTPLERSIHVTKGASKPVLKIQGVKKADWKSASDNVAKVEKNKVKAGNAAGNTVLTASANGLEYKINVFVEDPAVSMSDAVGVSFETKSATKYEIVIPKGKEVTLSCASMDQPVVFKSTKPDIAFVDENGNVEARSKGKGKFTTKINGKTVTINVKVTE